eukprot:465409-Prymnesium_polylepis.2
MVNGSTALGLMSPNSTSASAVPALWPLPQLERLDDGVHRGRQRREPVDRERPAVAQHDDHLAAS